MDRHSTTNEIHIVAGNQQSPTDEITEGKNVFLYPDGKNRIVVEVA